MKSKRKQSLTIISVLLVLIFSLCSCKKDERPLSEPLSFHQRVVIDTSKEMLTNSPLYSEEAAEEAHLRLENSLENNTFDINKDLYLIFRYRSVSIVPHLQQLIKDYPQNELLPLWFLNTITQIGDKNLLQYVIPFTVSPNDMVREYAFNAFGFLGSCKDTTLLNSALAKETNGYICKTIEWAKKTITDGTCKNIISYLPQYYESSPKKIRFIYNRNIESSPDFRYTKQFHQRVSYPKTSRMIFPTQQFYFTLKYAPTSGFFGSGKGNSYHVGYDGAWAFEGLPVHSISKGVVRSVSHSLSWGNLITVESVKGRDTITVIYGHLSRYICVKPGDIISVGDKIGQIGNSVSYENGGYWSHLHLGIVKGSYRKVQIVGYDSDLSKYEDPFQYIKEKSSK